MEMIVQWRKTSNIMQYHCITLTYIPDKHENAIQINPSNKNLHHPRNFDIVKFYFIVQCWALYGNVEFTKNFYWCHKLGRKTKQNTPHITAHLLHLHSALLTVVYKVWITVLEMTLNSSPEGAKAWSKFIDLVLVLLKVSD